MTTQNSAGPENPGTGAANLHRVTQPSEQRTASDRLPVVSATAVPPMGRRALWLIWAPACPHCGYGHAHRAGSATGGVRAAGCGRGDYHLKVVRAQGRAA